MPKRKNDTKSFFLLKEISEPDFGFTTGTCAAAASVAAARMLLTGKIVPYVVLTTPKGIKVFIEITNQHFSKEEASCSVQKFSGSDPDVTNGIEIFATVRKTCADSSQMVTDFQRFEPKITIKGGRGVGRVTLPGLDQKVGEWAINSVPRKMIIDGIKAEFERAEAGNLHSGFSKSLEVEISVPKGEEISKQTFNPKLGIIGGISILGTSGIVEPMSEQAILDTIRLEINVRKSQGYGVLLVVPGNYGADFLQSEFGFSPEISVHCSNFVYDSLKMAEDAGFKKIVFCGHIGKLIKVAGGVKNTHSKFGDRRMEILCEIAESFVPKNKFSSIKEQLLNCISTEQATVILDSLDKNHETCDKIMAEITRRIQKNMVEWTSGNLEIEVIIFTKEKGLLGETKNARASLEEK